jgi:hypothetical protein
MLGGLQPAERLLRTYARITLQRGRELVGLARKKLASEDGSF